MPAALQAVFDQNPAAALLLRYPDGREPLRGAPPDRRGDEAGDAGAKDRGVRDDVGAERYPCFLIRLGRATNISASVTAEHKLEISQVLDNHIVFILVIIVVPRTASQRREWVLIDFVIVGEKCRRESLPVDN